MGQRKGEGGKKKRQSNQILVRDSLLPSILLSFATFMETLHVPSGAGAVHLPL